MGRCVAQVIEFTTLDKKMTSHFEYKGHFGSAEVDSENGVLFGRLLYIRDVIGYDASTVQELRIAFEEAVDDYLESNSSGSEPQHTS
jgi:predicted HicB family RNase H-like nuclease